MKIVHKVHNKTRKIDNKNTQTKVEKEKETKTFKTSRLKLDYFSLFDDHLLIVERLIDKGYSIIGLT